MHKYTERRHRKRRPRGNIFSRALARLGKLGGGEKVVGEREWEEQGRKREEAGEEMLEFGAGEMSPEGRVTKRQQNCRGQARKDVEKSGLTKELRKKCSYETRTELPEW